VGGPVAGEVVRGSSGTPKPILRATVPFDRAFSDKTGGQAKILRRDYLPEGLLPVIDQGAAAVAGYTNDQHAAYRGPLPVLLFGDHTRLIKYVDFPFALGADGVKVLQPAPWFEPKFLYYFLLTADIPSRGYSRHFQFLRRIKVPLIPRSEQRRIVEILDQADRLRHLRAEAAAKADRILPALFIKMFGDPATNSMGWPIKRFDSICESRLGKMLDAKQQTGTHPRPYLRNANVYWDRLDLQDLLEMDFDESDRKEFRLERGDILICEGGEVGRCAIWSDELSECYFQKALHRARPFRNAAVSEFVVYLLWELATRGALQGSVSQVTFSHLTGVKLKALRVPVPPLSLQRAFANTVRMIKQVRKKLDSAHRIESLFEGLLHRAFSGSLTASWREAHIKELLQEMEQQAKALATG
jgi:type I restriction enzyme S subunit